MHRFSSSPASFQPPSGTFATGISLTEAGVSIEPSRLCLVHDAHIAIACDRFPAALRAVQQLTQQRALRTAQQLSPNGRAINHDRIKRAQHLAVALYEWRWLPLFDSAGNIGSLLFLGQDYDDDDLLMQVLAPFVAPDSYVVLSCANSASGWDTCTWSFHAGVCRFLPGASLPEPGTKAPLASPGGTLPRRLTDQLRRRTSSASSSSSAADAANSGYNGCGGHVNVLYNLDTKQATNPQPSRVNWKQLMLVGSVALEKLASPTLVSAYQAMRHPNLLASAPAEPHAGNVFTPFDSSISSSTLRRHDINTRGLPTTDELPNHISDRRSQAEQAAKRSQPHLPAGVALFQPCTRVIRKGDCLVAANGTAWLVLGDCSFAQLSCASVTQQTR